MGHTASGPAAADTPDVSRGSFVGRAAELDMLRRCLDHALAGRPRVVLVEGEAGIGKSRLVAELSAPARHRGALVLVGRCREGLNIPYMPIVLAVEPLGEEAGGATYAVDHTAFRSPPPMGASEQRPSASVIAACRAVVDAARRRPVVLVIEDLHWADPSTAELFEELVASVLHAGAASSAAVLLAATMRPPTRHVASTAERIRRYDEVSTVRLTGMTELELNELLTSLGSSRPSRALLSSVAQASGGNPLLARTLLDRLSDTGGVAVRGGELVSLVGEISPLPGGLDEELRRRLDGVGHACRQLLTTAAFLGDGGLLSDLEGVAPEDFDRLLDEAEMASLLTDDGARYHFDHPLLRQLLFHAPGGRRRQRLHLALADHLEARHGSAGLRAMEIADHLRSAAAGVDRARLAKWCLAAGEQAFALGAWGEAARYLDLVLATHPPEDGRERARLSYRAGLGHFRDHDLRSTEQRLLEAIAGAQRAGDVDTWSSAALLLTRAQMTIGSASVGARIDTSLLEELRHTVEGDHRRVGEIDGLLAEVHFHAFDVDRGMALLEDARRVAARSHDDELLTNLGLAAGLQYLGRLELDAATAAFHESAEHARRLPDPWKRVWGVGRLPLAGIASGQLASAADHASEAARIAAANHDWAEHALASACAMQLAAVHGDFAAAEMAGAEALQMYRRSDYSFVPTLVYLALAMVRSARGDFAGADRALDDWAASGGRGLAPYRLLVIASSLDRPALAAARPFRPVGGRPTTVFNLTVLCAQVEVAAVLDDIALMADAAQPLAAAHRAGVRWSLGWPMLVARLLATANRVLGRLDDAERWCEVAAKEGASNGALVELARVELERALLASSAGDQASARKLAAVATASFDGRGMLPLAQLARRMSGDQARGPRVERTILFTDLVGSTAINIRRGDAAYLELLREHNRILRRRLRQFDGVEIKHTGDGIASWFSSATAACECAVALRDDLAQHNAGRPDAPLLVRFGLASGTPIPHEGDLFGVSVSLAARMCDQAAAGQILAAEEVVTSATSRRLSFRPLQPLALKGFPEPVPAYAVGAGDG